MHPKLPHRPSRHERGVALVVVVFVLIAVLAGGLAAVAIASGELAATYSYRSRAVVESCAQAAVEKVRAKLPTLTVADLEESFALPNGTSVKISARHMDESTTGTLRISSSSSPLLPVASNTYDVSAFGNGMNVTNDLASSGSTGMKIYSVVVTCEGPGGAKQEVQLLMRYGVDR
jgi:hypothetical protein